MQFRRGQRVWHQAWHTMPRVKATVIFARADGSSLIHFDKPYRTSGKRKIDEKLASNTTLGPLDEPDVDVPPDWGEDWDFGDGDYGDEGDDGPRPAQPQSPIGQGVPQRSVLAALNPGDFDQCVSKQRKRGLAKENAARYCGAIKRDVEGDLDAKLSSRHSVVVEAEPGHLTLGESHQDAGSLPWYSVHYDYLSEDLLKLGFRVFAEERVDGRRFPVGWWVSIPPGATYEKTSAQGIADSYQDTIGPITVKVVDDQGFGFDDDDDDDGPTPMRPQAPPGRSLKQPKSLVAVLASEREALKKLKALPRVREDDGGAIKRDVEAALSDKFWRGQRVVWQRDAPLLGPKRKGTVVYPDTPLGLLVLHLDKPFNDKTWGVITDEVLAHKQGVTPLDEPDVDVPPEWGQGWDFGDDWRPDDEGNDGPRLPKPRQPAEHGVPQRSILAALNPDDWSYDFATLLDALEFKQRLADSGPMGRQVADKLVFRKKRLRYMAYGLPHHEKAFLERFVGQDRGPWQKQAPYDEVM